MYEPPPGAERERERERKKTMNLNINLNGNVNKMLSEKVTVRETVKLEINLLAYKFVIYAVSVIGSNSFLPCQLYFM